MSSRKSSSNLVPVSRSARGNSKNKLTVAKKISPKDRKRSCRRSPSSSSLSSDEEYEGRNREVQPKCNRNNRRDLVKYGRKSGGRRLKATREEIIENETRTINRTTRRVNLRYDDSDTSSDSSTDDSSSSCDDC